VLAAGRSDRQIAKSALEGLCKTYWYPLYAFARRKGLSAEDAADAIQAFFARLLEGRWVAAANPQRGRFRAFLSVALDRFLIKQWRAATAAKRGGGRTMLSIDCSDGERRYANEPADLATPERLFERRWALTVLEQALAAVESEYAAAGKGDLFRALRDTLTGGAPREYRVLGEELGMSEGAVKVAVYRLRQRFSTVLRALVADTVAAPEEIEDELRRLIEAVGPN
jgi:RNA polymerase sigma-70 factor (ECF subfamily)